MPPNHVRPGQKLLEVITVGSDHAAARSEPQTQCWIGRPNDMEAHSKRGWLRKSGALSRALKDRLCVLIDHQLYYYRRETDTQPAGTIPVQSAKIEVVGLARLHLTARGSSRVFVFEAPSTAERDDWLTELKRASCTLPPPPWNTEKAPSCAVPARGVEADQCDKSCLRGPAGLPRCGLALGVGRRAGPTQQLPAREIWPTV